MNDQYVDYFGVSDASRVSNEVIGPGHQPRKYEKYIKSYDRNVGKQIVVGIKGSGKTDLRKYIEGKEDAIIVNLDADNKSISIDASEYQERSGRIKNAIALLFVNAFINELATNDTRFENWGARAKEIYNNIPSAVVIDAKLAKINLKDLLNTELDPYVPTVWKEVKDQIISQLEGKKAYLMIDDTEDVFLGLESNPAFIEGLARAAYEINDETGNKLHVLVFMKYGIWRLWYENQKEYDRVEAAIFHISWNKKSLSKLIARRIANIHTIEIDEIKDEDVESFWEKEFSWEKSGFQKFIDFIYQYCVSGPRDMIVLCNKSKEIAKDNKIEIRHIKEILSDYSENKLYEINADFGDVYPQIHKFIEALFQKMNKETTGTEVANFIEQKAMNEPRIDEVYIEYPWYKRAGKQQLTSILYKIGLLGIKRNNRVIYSMESPMESTRTIIDSELIFHPAFRPHLGIE